MKYHAECIFPNLIHVVESDVDTDIKDYCLNKKLNNPRKNTEKTKLS